MTTALVERPKMDAKVIEQVLLGGDLSKLSTEQRLTYYQRTCESLGLNPLTKPFDYLTLNGKTVLYARKDATEQLRMIHDISIDPKTFTREVIEGIYVVTAPASMPSGRTDVSTGAVAIDGLKGEARANAMMKAETKAKRRVTLSICGLGMLDETEVGSIPGAQTGDPQPALVVDALPDVPDPALPTGTVLIRHVTSGATAKGKQFWMLTLSTGEQVKEWDARRATFAEQAAQEKWPVTLETKTTQWGTDVKALHRAILPLPEIQIREPHDANEPPPLTDEELKDLPF